MSEKPTSKQTPTNPNLGQYIQELICSQEVLIVLALGTAILGFALLHR